MYIHVVMYLHNHWCHKIHEDAISQILQTVNIYMYILHEYVYLSYIVCSVGNTGMYIKYCKNEAEIPAHVKSVFLLFKRLIWNVFILQRCLSDPEESSCSYSCDRPVGRTREETSSERRCDRRWDTWTYSFLPQTHTD